MDHPLQLDTEKYLGSDFRHIMTLSDYSVRSLFHFVARADIRLCRPATSKGCRIGIGFQCLFLPGWHFFFGCWFGIARKIVFIVIVSMVLVFVRMVMLVLLVFVVIMVFVLVTFVIAVSVMFVFVVLFVVVLLVVVIVFVALVIAVPVLLVVVMMFVLVIAASDCGFSSLRVSTKNEKHMNVAIGQRDRRTTTPTQHFC